MAKRKTKTSRYLYLYRYGDDDIRVTDMEPVWSPDIEGFSLDEWGSSETLCDLDREMLMGRDYDVPNCEDGYLRVDMSSIIVEQVIKAAVQKPILKVTRIN